MKILWWIDIYGCYLMKSNQEGIGLPEVFISLLLASFTLILLMNQYLNAKQHYLYFQEALDRHMDMELVTDLLRKSVHKAGFTPCSGIEHLITADEHNEMSALKSIVLWKNKHSSVQINRMSEHFDVVLDMVDAESLLSTEANVLKRGQKLLIADCYHAEVKEVQTVIQTSAGQFVRFTHPLIFQYRAPIYLGEWIQEAYFIGTDQHLFYRFQQTEELTTVVKSMSSKIESYDARLLLQVIFGLRHEKPIIIETMVRTP